MSALQKLRAVEKKYRNDIKANRDIVIIECLIALAQEIDALATEHHDHLVTVQVQGQSAWSGVERRHLTP